MARTLIGQLILTLQQNFSAEAPKVEQSVAGILESVNRLAAAPWGAKFQRQLDVLRLAPEELRAVQTSWDKLFADMKSTDLTSALQRTAFADWRTGVVSHFAAVRDQMTVTETRTKAFAERIRATMSPVMGFLGYAGAGVAGYEMTRSGVDAAAKRMHERFLESQANTMSPLDQATLAAKSMTLAQQYPVSATAIMALGRAATGSLADPGRALANLETIVQAQTVVDNLSPELKDRLVPMIKSADLLNLTKAGPDGSSQFRNYLDGIIRAAQVEGPNFDPGKMLQFAQRAKISRLALDPEFLSTVVPALVTDMGSSQAGTAMATAFKSFLLGDPSLNGKTYQARQKALGIRGANGELVEGELYGRNPYDWVKQVLVPALTKAGTNMSDPTAVSKAVGQLSSNTNATQMLTTMIEQRWQFDRAGQQYHGAMGLDAAVGIEGKDPYAAWAGLTSAFDNFAAAVADKTDIIVPGLNKLTAALNAMAAWVEQNPTPAVLAAGAGVGVAGFAAWKGLSGIGGLITAGPHLNTAADRLILAAEALGDAAAKQGGAGLVRDAENAAPAAAGFGLDAILAGITRLAGPIGAAYTAWQVMKPVPTNLDETQRLDREVPGYQSEIGRIAAQMKWAAPYTDSMSQAEQSGIPDAKEKVTDLKSALDAVQNGQVIPKIDVTQIQLAKQAAAELLGILHQIGAWTASSGAPAIHRELNRSMSDYGVTPGAQ